MTLSATCSTSPARGPGTICSSRARSRLRSLSMTCRGDEVSLPERHPFDSAGAAPASLRAGGGLGWIDLSAALMSVSVPERQNVAGNWRSLEKQGTGWGRGVRYVVVNESGSGS